jgi:hypothetical protein
MPKRVTYKVSVAITRETRNTSEQMGEAQYELFATYAEAEYAQLSLKEFLKSISTRLNDKRSSLTEDHTAALSTASP